MTDGACPRCAGDHDGYEAGTLGAELRCLHAQALRLNAPLLAHQILELQAGVLAAGVDEVETFGMTDGFGNVVGHVVGSWPLDRRLYGSRPDWDSVPLEELIARVDAARGHHPDQVIVDDDQFVGTSVHYDGGELDLDRVRRDDRRARLWRRARVWRRVLCWWHGHEHYAVLYTDGVRLGSPCQRCGAPDPEGGR